MEPDLEKPETHLSIEGKLKNRLETKLEQTKLT